MPISLRIKKTLAGAALLCATLSSDALTLGRINGAVLVGRPLDLGVQVVFQPDEDVSSFCFDAEVYYADSHQDSSRVKVSYAAGSVANTANVRITSSIFVDEPVVAIELRAGCSHKTSRRYVLLADFPSELAMLSGPVKSLPAGSSGGNLVASVGAPPAVLSGYPKITDERQVSPRRLPGLTKPLIPQRASVEMHRVEQGVKKSRLKLDAVALSLENEPMLKASSELLSFPSDDPQRRADAAAWWVAINRSAQDVLRDSAKTHELENNLQVLRTLASKNQVTQTELKNQLQKAESERFSKWLVFGLLSLLIVSMAGLIYLWRRKRLQSESPPEWWGESMVAEPTHEQRPPSVQKFDSTYRPNLSSSKAVDQDLSKVDIGLPSESVALDSLLASMSAPPAPREEDPGRDHVTDARDFSHSMAASMLTSDTQELFDTRQQADFFVALGQHDKAVEVLERCIYGGGDSSAQVYLDLLKLFNKLGRKADYDNLKEQFKLIFDGTVSQYGRPNID